MRPAPNERGHDSMTKRNRTISLLAVAVAVIVLFVATFLIVPEEQLPPGPTSVRLSNGSEISITGVSYGTIHTQGSGFRAWLERVSPRLGSIVDRIRGRRIKGFPTFTTTKPTLVVWLQITNLRPSPSDLHCDIILSDSNGVPAGSEEWCTATVSQNEP